MRYLSCLVIAVAALTAGLDGQVAVAGRAAVSGRVTDAYGDPVLRARVLVEALADANTTRTVAAGETDDRGEYRIGRLSAGEYVIAVLRLDTVVVTPTASFAASSRGPTRTYYPFASQPNEAEVVRLGAGEEVESIDFSLPSLPPSLPPVVVARAQPGSVAAPANSGSAILRGRVVTPDKRAVPYAHLRIVPAGDIVQTRVAVTDAQGRFEFRAVAAGPVRVFASKPGYDPVAADRRVEVADAEPVENVDLVLARWSAISGQVSDDRGEPPIGCTVQALHVRFDGGRRRLVPAGGARPTDDRGRYRLYGLAPGRYVISASVSGLRTTDAGGFAPSYYPGTANPGSAQFVSISVAQEIDGIDIALERAATVRVTGKVVGADGQPRNPGSLSLVSSVRSISPVSVSLGARLSADGTFEFPNVSPGQYVIRADRGRSRPWMEGEFGTLAVAVGNADLTDLTVQTSPGSSVSGRFTFNARDPGRRPAPSTLELRPLPVDFDAAPSTVATANIQPDWTFEVSGLNGARRLQVTRLPAGWAVQEMTVRGIDVTDRPIPFGRREQSLSEMEITLTDRVTELTATIAGDNTTPTAAVVAFPTDRSRWYPQSRFMRRAAAGSDGTASIAGLPFGSYYIAAVAALPGPGEDDWQDPAFLEGLLSYASTITLGEGQPQAVKLELPGR